MGCCGDASGWAKIGLLCTICALGLQVAGYVTNNWMVYNTVKDQIDVRVGLFWFTNCSSGISCYTTSTPSMYKSLYFTLTQALEGGTAGLLCLITIIFCFYVMADRSRTRPVAVAIIILYVLAVSCSVAGLALWIIQLNYPYFVAWSAGLSVVATAFSLLALLCIIPDIKEYPYERLHVMPEKLGNVNNKSTDHKKREAIGKEYSRRDPSSDFKDSRYIGNEYGRHDPYPSKNKKVIDDEYDRFSLNVVTPSQPPRADFFNRVPNGNRY